jgi:DNA polymerase III sliding clamp (beta) subunit (PCNA family)
VTKLNGKSKKNGGPMTAKIDAGELGPALDAVSKVASNSRNAAVYKCVLVNIHNGRLSVRGTNLVVFVERWVKVDSDLDGVWLVVFEQFYHFVKNVAGPLTLSFSKDELVIKSGKSRATAKLRDPKEFMTWPKWQSLVEISAPAQSFIEALRKSIPSVSSTFADPALYNISVKPASKGHADVQASNNHRYQLLRLPMKMKTGVLIPLNGAIHLADLSDAKRVAVSNGLLGVQTTSGRVFCNLSEGEERYPTFSEFLPTRKKITLSVTVDRAKLARCVTLAKGFADKKYRRLQLTISGTELVIESSVRSGDFKAGVPLKKKKGKDISLLMDAEDIERFLSMCGSDDFTMHFTGPTGQVLILDPEQENFFYVANPLIAAETADAEKYEDAPPAEQMEAIDG